MQRSMNTLCRNLLRSSHRTLRYASTSTSPLVDFPSTSAKSSEHEPSDDDHDIATIEEEEPRGFTRTFSMMFPDFLPALEYDRRNPLRERLERRDMLRRRMHIEIPEFYVGTIMAVTQADSYAPSRLSRFLGICIERKHVGLKHMFTLRNFVDGQGVEISYELYSPMLQKIEVIRLQKSADPHLQYLRDAPPEFSTFPQNMDPEIHSASAPVPELKLKVTLRPAPWTRQWHRLDLKGIDNEQMWENVTAWYKGKFIRARHAQEREYDVVLHYRDETCLEDQEEIYDEMQSYAKQPEIQEKLTSAKRKYLYPKVVRKPDKD